MESGEILSPSKTPEMETFQTKEIRKPVESSRVRDAVVVHDFLIPTLTETLPVLSPGTVSTVLGKSWDTGKEDDRTPIFFHSTFGGGVCYSGLFSPHFHTKSGHPAVGTSTTDIPALATGQKSYLFSNTFFS